MNAFLDPIRARRAEDARQTECVNSIFRSGTERAEHEAALTMTAVHQAMAL